MTEDELGELLHDCPTLYHMAECGSWPFVVRHGLLSTSRLLKLFGIGDDERAAFESSRRPEKLILDHPSVGRAVLRDQKPMDDAGLRKCLGDDLRPADWYRLLNQRVFFWLTKWRLDKLRSAKSYRTQPHDIIKLDTRRLVEAYRPQIELSSINSGATKPFAQPRGRNTFSSIDDFDYAGRRQRPGRDRVVELTVLDAIPDVTRFVTRVIRACGTDESVLYAAAERDA